MEKIKDWGLVVFSGLLFITLCLAFFITQLDGDYINPIIVFNVPHRPSQPVYSQDTPCLPLQETHKTTKVIYHVGDMVEAYINIDKFREIPGIIQWSLMDKRYYPYVARRGVLPIGDVEQIVQIERIPDHVPPGKYYFSGTVSYHVNRWRWVHFAIKTNCFEVIK